MHNGKTKVKPSRLLLAIMHYRAHPRHYRSEYVRGYLHRKRCVQPSRLVVINNSLCLSDDSFKDIFLFSKDCRFNNCTHTHEPGCAVLKAVEEHYISASRYQRYLSMLQDKDENKYLEAY